MARGGFAAQLGVAGPPAAVAVVPVPSGEHAERVGDDFQVGVNVGHDRTLVRPVFHVVAPRLVHIHATISPLGCENVSVTLVMMIMRREGIWLLTDRRVTRAGRPEPDAPKQLVILCPPTPGQGPRILLSFTGIAEMPYGTPTLQWIRETIRGESRPLVPLLEHLRDRLTRDVGKRSALWKQGLALVGGILDGDGTRLLMQISNIRQRPWSDPSREFKLLIDKMPNPVFMAIGSGQPHISRQDGKLAVAQTKIRPRKWEDHAALLAAINRRTAKKTNGGVSPWCDVTFISVEREGAICQLFREPGDPPVPVELNLMLDGIDTTEIARLMMSVPPGTLWPKDEEEQATRRQVEGRP